MFLDWKHLHVMLSTSISRSQCEDDIWLPCVLRWCSWTLPLNWKVLLVVRQDRFTQRITTLFFWPRCDSVTLQIPRVTRHFTAVTSLPIQMLDNLLLRAWRFPSNNCLQQVLNACCLTDRSDVSLTKLKGSESNARDVSATASIPVLGGSARWPKQALFVCIAFKLLPWQPAKLHATWT